MNARVVVTLPFPPSVNAMWRSAPGRGPVPTKEAEVFFAQVSVALAGRTPLFGRIDIWRLSFFPRRSSSDIDGPFKALFDALNGRLWLDDNQVKAIDGIRMNPPAPNPRVELEMVGERFCTPQEVKAHLEAKAERSRKRKATLAANRQKKQQLLATAQERLNVPGETTAERINRLARPASYPPRQG